MILIRKVPEKRRFLPDKRQKNDNFCQKNGHFYLSYVTKVAIFSNFCFKQAVLKIAHEIFTRPARNYTRHWRVKWTIPQPCP